MDRRPGYVVVDLVVKRPPGGQQHVFTVSGLYNALTIAPGVSITKLSQQLGYWGIKTQFRNGARGATLFFEQYGRGTIAFVDSQPRSSGTRYQLHLYLEQDLDLDDFYGRGVQLLAAGKEAEALHHWHFVLSRYGLHRETVYELAEYHFARGNFERAEELYEITIDLDERTWVYPEARIRYAIAGDKLPQGLSTKHGMCLADYVRYGKGAQVLKAEQLLMQVRNPVKMDPVTPMTNRSILRKIQRGRQVIVHFWSPESDDGWTSLGKLFAFSVRHREIPIYVVATRDGNQLRMHERRLTKQYAPFWPLEGTGNVQFLYDEVGLLQQTLFGEGSGATRAIDTLFLERGAVLRHETRVEDWEVIGRLLRWNNG
ncbi:MAG: hypothetical protein AAF564_10355 [Bacteroidota bacterium]